MRDLKDGTKLEQEELAWCVAHPDGPVWPRPEELDPQ